MRTARPLSIMITAAVLATALAACAPDPDAVTSAGAGGASGPGSTSSPTDAQDPTAAPTEATAAPASPTECLVGDWLVDNAHMAAFFASLVPADAGGQVSRVEGDVTMRFNADGTYAVDYDSWTMHVTQDGMAIEMVRDGTDRGTYTADDSGALTQTDTEMGSTVSLNVAGQGGYSTETVPASVTATFVCDADTLTVTQDGMEGVLHRR